MTSQEIRKLIEKGQTGNALSEIKRKASLWNRNEVSVLKNRLRRISSS